mgnify:CR=1 FL=1
MNDSSLFVFIVSDHAMHGALHWPDAPAAPYQALPRMRLPGRLPHSCGRQPRTRHLPRLRDALESLKEQVEGIVMVYDRPFSRTDHEAIDSTRPLVMGEIRNRQVVFAYDEDRKRDALSR